MGFFKKIFKKKKKTSADVKNVAAVKKESQQRHNNAKVPNGSTPSNEPGRIISPRNNNHNQRSPSPDENFDHSNAVSPKLSHQQLEAHNSYANQPPMVHQAVFQMSADLPSQQMYAMDEMYRSDASSSSFNLSTDAEDSEYENLRSRGVLPGTITNPSALDMNMTALSNPASYATDQETVFPGLDDMTMPSMTTATSKDQRSSALDPARNQQEEMARKLGLMPPPEPRPPTPDDEPGYIPSPTKNASDNWVISPSTAASNDPLSIKGVDSDPSSWGISPSSNEPDSTKSSKSNQYFHFEEDPTMKEQMASTVAASSTISRNTPRGPKRNFTSPKSQASSDTGFSNEFDNTFAEFGNFKEWDEKKMEYSKPVTNSNYARGDFDRAFDSYQPSSSISPNSQQITSSTSPYQQDRSLSELMAKAKEKNRNSGSPNTPGRPRRSQTTSNSSANSAPAITSSYLRQHYNLGKYSKNDREASRGVSNDETSVSDIIQSLEVSNQIRRSNSGRNLTTSNRSLGDTGGSSISQLAKERLRDRERRRREHEYKGGMHTSDSSENSDNEAAETWLFDEVTGALGPKGIAADLESLSGRSNRSKNSRGDRSHRSRHSRRKSSSRKPRTSNESVGSRESRQSKNSRYSHRSTKSFISQMSEQSKSVAQDLLRLEMQLAMVGQENGDDLPALSGGSLTGTSLGGSSRHRSSSRNKSSYSSSNRSTSSTSIAKRIKVMVIAPPGKLGIILANKADGKGTVVSGVRTSSILVDKISPGDRIVAIDGEDVSRITVSEITTIMSRKAAYDRNLTVLTLPKYNNGESAHSPKADGDYHSPINNYSSSAYDNSYQQQYRR